MAVRFLFDTADVANIPGLARKWDSDEPFLTPVFFNAEVLVRYLYDPRFSCTFCSKTYGQIESLNGEWDLVFGVNPNGRVVAWLGDVRKLPDNEQQSLSAENVPSDHNIDSDFYDAQLNIRYDLTPILEVEILIAKSRLNSVLNERFGFPLYRDSADISVPDIQKHCSRYQKVAFNSEDDLKRFVSEWFEILVEDIDVSALRSYLESTGRTGLQELKGMKLLERFAVDSLGDTENRVAPVFYLGDLRIWADHRDSQSKYDRVAAGLNLAVDHTVSDLYHALMKEIHGFYVWLQQEVLKRAS